MQNNNSGQIKTINVPQIKASRTHGRTQVSTSENEQPTIGTIIKDGHPDGKNTNDRYLRPSGLNYNNVGSSNKIILSKDSKMNRPFDTFINLYGTGSNNHNKSLPDIKI